MIENSVEAARVLAVSKDPGVVRSLWSIVETNSWQLETVGSGWEALAMWWRGDVSRAAPQLPL